MSTHPSTNRKLLAWIVILVQILAMTSTGLATVVQPTPQLAQSAAHDLRRPGWLAESFAGLAWGAQQSFGAPQIALAQAASAGYSLGTTTGQSG